MKYIITTVGTSIFTNYIEDVSDVIKGDFDHIEKVPANKWEDYSIRIKRIKKEVENWAKKRPSASAELKSIQKIINKFSSDNEKEFKIYLIATDIISSKLAGEILASVIPEQMGVEVEFNQDYVIKGLQVENAKEFERKGIVNLVDKIVELFKSYYYKNFILNITGGYKALIPFMTILGQIYNVPIYYIFEDTDELIEIPQVPINIDFGVFEKYADIIDKLNEGTYNWSELEDKINDSLRSLIWYEGDMAELNAIGKMLYRLYADFIHIRIQKGSNFWREKEGERNQLIKTVNELYTRLKTIVNNNNLIKKENPEAELLKVIKSLGDNNDLRHGRNPGENVFIFKSTKQEQVRLVYTPKLLKDGEIIIILYDYVRGNFNHDEYIEEFKKRFMAGKYTADFIDISIKKEEKNV